MTEYIIDITIDNIFEGNLNHNCYTTFYIKIDKNGNVDIKRNYTYLWPPRICDIYDFVIINDNIPIPSYIINMIKNSFCTPKSATTNNFKTNLPGGNHSRDDLSLRHYENTIENIIIVKEELAKYQSIQILIDLL